MDDRSRGWWCLRDRDNEGYLRGGFRNKWMIGAGMGGVGGGGQCPGMSGFMSMWMTGAEAGMDVVFCGGGGGTTPWNEGYLKGNHGDVRNRWMTG